MVRLLLPVPFGVLLLDEAFVLPEDEDFFAFEVAKTYPPYRIIRIDINIVLYSFQKGKSFCKFSTKCSESWFETSFLLLLIFVPAAVKMKKQFL